ncbi:hypothetical protein HBI60_124800 [Parastagonospora nodorum]|nr:hypothetical protein HBI60_124800 [Parastagonospora nodorum]
MSLSNYSLHVAASEKRATCHATPCPSPCQGPQHGDPQGSTPRNCQTARQTRSSSPKRCFVGGSRTLFLFTLRSTSAQDVAGPSAQSRKLILVMSVRAYSRFSKTCDYTKV